MAPLNQCVSARYYEEIFQFRCWCLGAATLSAVDVVGLWFPDLGGIGQGLALSQH